MWDPNNCKTGAAEPHRSRLIVWMSLRWVIPGELLSSIARFRFAHRSHPKPKSPVRLLKTGERQPSQNSAVSLEGSVQPVNIDSGMLQMSSAKLRA